MSVNARRLKSGKVVYDVRLRTPEGRPYKRTFATKREAETFEANERTDRHRGAWVDPHAGRILFADYAERPVASIPQVYDLAGAVPDRLRAMVLLALFRRPSSRRATRADAVRHRPRRLIALGHAADASAEGRHPRTRSAQVRRRRSGRGAA